MGTIDTILFRFRPLTVDGVTYRTVSDVPFSVWVRVAAAVMASMLEKRRTRIHLSQLTAQELRDIGVTPDQADAEIRKSLPFYERAR